MTATIMPQFVTSSCLVLALLTAPIGAAAAAPGDDAPTAADAAAEARADAQASFARGDFEGSIRGFARAYEIDPHPSDLYNIGRVYEQIGDLVLALRYYEHFGAQPDVAIADRAKAAERIAVLRVLVDREPPADTPPEPAATPAPVSPRERPRAVDAAPPTVRVRDPWLISGASLLAVGTLTAVATGVGFGLVAAQADREISRLHAGSNPDRLTLAQAEELEARGRNAEVAQIAALATSGVVAAVGVALVITGLVRRRPVRARLAARGAGVGLGWRF